MPIGIKKSYPRLERYYDVEKDMDAFDAVKIEPILPTGQGRSYIYKITVENKHSSAVTAEITFKRKSNPAQIGDFLIYAVK